MKITHSVQERISTDRTTLNIVQGYKIEFDTILVQYSIPQKVFTTDKESKIAPTEIERLLSKGVIEKASHT